MRLLSLVLLLILGLNANANKRASEIYLELQKLRSLKRVLYIAAHPDDENTRALAYFSLGEKAQTAYLSLTRGGGGQNLIGNELSEELGVLRTQELLAARSYDGARQFFSRAVDFGYSKSASESLGKWGDEEILSDVVLVIRKFRPDVIITRFPPDKRGGHGHHTASAMLAIEAFEKAADPNFLPEQVEQYGTWETTSIYWNTSYWWMKDIADSAKNNPDYLSIDIGGYCSELGMSYNEIGTIARSQHKCQGFGAIIERGSRIEYFQHLAGAKLSESFFEKSEKSWTKLINQQFQTDLDRLVDNFDFKAPSKNVDALLTVHKGLQSLDETRFKNEKISLCNQLIVNCMGLYIELVGSDYSFVSGDSMEVSLNIVNRSDLPVEIAGVGLNGTTVLNKPFNVPPGASKETTLKYLSKESLGGPYWLKNEHTDLFVIDNKLDLGKAKGSASLIGAVTIKVSGKELELQLPAEYKWRDPSYGEKRREMVCTPPFSVSFDQDITILKPGAEKEITLTVHSYSEVIKSEFKLQLPKGWHASSDIIKVDIPHKHDEKIQKFKISVDENAEDGFIEIRTIEGKTVYTSSEIAYDHIPTQMLLTPAKMKCVKLDAEIKKGRIAYINGVKDAVPAAIAQLGFEVQQFEVKDLANIDLSQFQTVVLGIRIYNVHPELLNMHDKLFGYVQEGGNLVMQYNTASRSIRDQEFGPIPFKLSRNRVTEEDAAVTFLDSDHPIMNSPNKLTQKDFEGWVQERGLYFADDWNEAYTPLFSWHDKGEEDQKGALIVAKHGKGQFIYTGISFFRELPNGVPGAYRLFANILSYPYE